MWKDVKGYEGIYEVSNTGDIKRKSYTYTRKSDGAIINVKSRIMKTRVLKGYETIGLTKDGKQRTKPVHRIIAEAFIPNPENKPEVNHKDGNKLNNEINNLEWVTRSENDLHAFKLGLRKVTDGGTSKMIARVCPKTNDIIETYPSLRELERATNYNRKYVSLACRNNEIYKDYYWRFV